MWAGQDDTQRFKTRFVPQVFFFWWPFSRVFHWLCSNVQPFFSFTFWQSIFNLEKSFFFQVCSIKSLIIFSLSNNQNYIFINAIESFLRIDVIEPSANSTAGAFRVPACCFSRMCSLFYRSNALCEIFFHLFLRFYLCDGSTVHQNYYLEHLSYFVLRDTNICPPDSDRHMFGIFRIGEISVINFFVLY